MPDVMPLTVTTLPDVGISFPSIFSLGNAMIDAFFYISVGMPLYSCLLLVAPLQSSNGLHISGKSYANAVSFSDITLQMSFSMQVALLALLDMITKNFLSPNASMYSNIASAAVVFPEPLGSSMLYGLLSSRAFSICLNAILKFSDGGSSNNTSIKYVYMKFSTDFLANSFLSLSTF